MSAVADERRVPPERWAAELTEALAQGYVVLDVIAAVDERDQPEPGVEVVAELVDPTPGALRRLAVHVRVPDGSVLATVSTLWPGAAWHERVAAELTGVAIEGAEERLLLPTTYDGPPPLAKSAPLAARGSRPWPGAVEPGEAEDTATGRRSPGRRRQRAPGVPEGWPA